MSELNELLQEDPDFMPFGDWEKTNDSGDAITNRQNYAEYVRGEYVNVGSYSPRIENEIRQATFEGALTDGVVTPDADETTINSLFTPAGLSFEGKLNLIRKNLPFTDPAAQAAFDYFAFQDHPPTGLGGEELKLMGEERRAAAEATAEEGYQKALRIAVRNNEIPFAKVTDADGEEDIIYAPNLEGIDPIKGIEASRSAGVSMADANKIKSLFQVPVGYTEQYYKVKRYDEAANTIQEMMKDNKRIASEVNRYIESVVYAEKKPEKSTTPIIMDGVRRVIKSSGLLPEDSDFTNEEIEKAVTQIAFHTANANGQFKLYDDPAEASKNVRAVGYMAPLVHPAAMVNDDLFRASVTNNANLSDQQKKVLETQREPFLQQNFDRYNKILSQSGLSDEWLNAVQSGRVAGKDNTTILREFTSDPDNFSELKDRAVGIGESIIDGIGTLVAAVPMMMGADWARDYMVNNIRDNANRREVANLFGVQYGIGQDIAETIAPMLTDIAATVLLSGPTMGVGGAAYLTAKQGARLTAKGLVKAAVSNTFKQLPKESAEMAAERIAAAGLIRASTAEAGKTGAMKAIQAYNGVVAKQIGNLSAMAIPAFNRSAGMTYAGVYSTLQDKGELTPEEIHDRALGAGLTAGTITAVITAGFSAFGRGGLEDAIIGGASRKQLKEVVSRLAKVDDITDKVFDEVVAKQLSESLKRFASGSFGKQVLKNSFDEGVEEGLDEFINGIVTDAATDETTPFLERLEQAGRAAIIGGVIGAGTPVVRSAINRIGDGGRAAMAAAEVEFAKGVSEKLAASGSPVAAQTVYSILTAPRRFRAPIALSILEASRRQQQEAEVLTEAPAEAPAEADFLSPQERAAADRMEQLSPEERKIQTDLNIQRIIANLNNNVSPDTVAQAIADERGQTMFDFMGDLQPNEVAKRSRKSRKTGEAKSPVAEQLELDFAAKKPAQESDQLDLGLDVPNSSQPKVVTKRTNVASQSNKKTRLADQLELDFNAEVVSEQDNHIDPNADEVEVAAAPAPSEPVFDIDEFIDDELIGREVSAMVKLASLGYPVRMQRNALYGMPQRGKYPKGYLAGKADLLARKVGEMFPTWDSPTAIKASEVTGKDKVTYYDTKAKKVVRQRPKAFVDENGVGIFNNDPVSVKVLLDARIPVVVPADFTGTINPAFRTAKSGDLVFINDIVTVNPETGRGFVSALTKQDRVLSGEPNYRYYDDLASFIAIFNNGVRERTVPDPKGRDAQVTLDSIILDTDMLSAAASSGRPNSRFGDPSKAQATLRALLKPRQGTLDQDFFEAAVPAFNMAARKEVFLHELRLSLDKFGSLKDGEATPALNPKSIQPAIRELMARTKMEGPNARVDVARVLAKVFGSDINPEAQPDLVIKNFIENVVFIRNTNMPTMREIGSRVGNAFAQQQRERSLAARKALFQTTDPNDLVQVQDDLDAFDPEKEAADNNFIPPTGDYGAVSFGEIRAVIEQATFDVADALDSDPELREAIDQMLRETVFKGNSAIDVTKFDSTDAFGMLASWMASGNYNTNPAAIRFQRQLRDGEYASGEPLRRALKLMSLSSKTTDGDPSQDAEFVQSLRENLAASLGRPVSVREASDFMKSIGSAVQRLWSRSYVRAEQTIFARQQNDAEVERLGLRTGDPQSVINALKKIAATDADPNKKLLAKLLLENQNYIRQVEFSLDESPMPYAGMFIKASNGQPMVSINLDGHNGRGVADVLLHEYLHAFVSITVSTPNENLTTAQRTSLQRINGILDLARQSAADSSVTDPALMDGLENVNEFVAHFFTSTDFQSFMKALLPPQKQRGFFRRMIDAVLDMFGLNRSKQSAYQQAFTDIVDLTRSAVVSAPMTPKGLANQIARPASQILNRASEVAAETRRILGTSTEAAQEPTTETEVGAAVAEAAAELNAAVDAATGQITPDTVRNEATAETSAQLTAKMKEVIEMVRRMVPMEFALEFNGEIPYAAAFYGDRIIVNPARMAAIIEGLDATSSRGIVESIMTEEVAHAASYNALTQAEIDEYVGSLKATDYDDIADTYYQSDEARAEAKARLRSEDAEVVRVEREILAEEKLRMHAQKVTRGFTTEEDVAFWRSKPSLFKILTRYLKGFLNRYMAGRSVNSLNGRQRVVVQRIITEVRAVNAGYRMMPNTLSFDPNNPTGTLAQIASQMNLTVGEIEDQIIERQFGLATMVGVDPDFVKSQTVIGGEVGTRNPKTKDLKNTGFDPSMQVNLETMRQNPDVYRKNAILLTTYPIVARELRDSGKGDIVDRIRKLGNPVKKIEEQEMKQKELLSDLDAKIKIEVAKQKGVAKSRLRAFDIREATEAAQESLAESGETDLRKLTGLPKLINQKVKLEEGLAKIRESKKKAAEKAKTALNKIALSDKQFGIEDADAVYEALITATESNLSSLIEMFPPEVRKLAKLWYDGANRIAQRLAKAANVSVEQASGVLAVFSPQKDWFMNVSLAERMMKFWTENQDAVFDDAMIARYMMRAGEPQIKDYDDDDNPIYQGKAVPEVDAEGLPVIDPVTGRQKFKNWDTKAAEANLRKAALFIDQVRGKKFSELTEIQTEGMTKPMALSAVQARFIRMFSEVNDNPFFPVVTPDGRVGNASLSEKGKPISIAWGGYNTIEKAIRIMQSSGTPAEITQLVSNELGDKHKVRSFYNNIVAPMSDRGDVTMDTHAIAALLWRALSGASPEVTQNFGGAGTASDGALGLSGLYPAFAEAYRRAAANFDLLPREAQSITWEVVRILFPAKWKSNSKNVAAVNQVWEQYENGEINITEARERIFQLTPSGQGRTLAQAIAGAAKNGDGVGRPVWFTVGDGDADTRPVSRTDDQGQLSNRRGLRDVPLIDGGFTRTVGGVAGVVSEPTGKRGRAGTATKIRATQIGYEQRTPSIYERSLSIDADAGRRFSEGIRRTYAEHPMGKAVEVKPDEFYNDPTNRIFLDDDGLTGVAVTSYGDLVSVFKHPTSKTKITGLLEEASQYAVTLDAFDINGFLPELYSRYGFRPAARVPFSREYAPEGWPYDLAGEPDVILMVKDVKGVSGLPEIGDAGFEAVRDQVPVFEDYDEAMAAQQAAKEKVAAALTPRVSPTQFGATQLDADYLAAVEAGDMETAQRMVDEAAWAAGYDTKAYHGTEAKGFDTFVEEEGRPGMFFASLISDANNYGSNVINAYLKLGNSFKTTEAEIDAGGMVAGGAKDAGYDSITIKYGEGDINYAVFSPTQIKSADPVTYDEQGNVIPLSQRFQPKSPDIRYTQFGAGSQLPAAFDADSIDYSAFIESLEMPVLEVGTYQSPSTMLDKLFRGELDPRIQKLKDQRDFFNKATFDLVRRYKAKLDAIIKKDFGGIEDAPVSLIQDAIGSTKGVVVPPDVMEQIEDGLTYDLEVIDMDDTLTSEDKAVAREIALARHKQEIADAEKAVAKEIRDRRDDALNELAKDSPELVRHIIQLRKLTDELSTKVTELYGFPPELKAKFDNQLGIYLTRTYRMFEEVGYGDRVLNDPAPAYEAKRQAAADFFEKQFIESEVARRIVGPNSVSRATAEAEARKALDAKSLNGRTLGQLMVEEFIKSYDNTGTALVNTNLSKSLKPFLDNVKMKRDLPKPIRDLLGEKGAEVGTDNLLRTLVTVGTMASNQSFLNHVRDIGRQSGWLLTAEELAAKRKTDYDTYGGYKQIRETVGSAYDPIGNLYGPPELVEAMRKTFSPDGMEFNKTTAEIAIQKTLGVAAKMSGGAMAAKTLGSIGFYIRNVVSNALFFAPAQGYFDLKSMAGNAYSEIWQNAVRDPNKIDAYRTKLISLGVIGDDINTNIMTAMLRGGENADSIESELDKLIDTAQKGMQPLAWLANRAQILSASVDAFYKMAYYENELRVLKEARAVDTGTLANKSDSELERMAADKVLATAQSASQAPPLIRGISKSGLGLLFAPFIRFKAEVPRIVLNTYRTAISEMSSRNPVLKVRGIKRFSGMTFMLGGISAISPAIASLVAGIGEDEDEALRAGLPEYLRNHTFFYFRRDNGQLQSWDFTFLNPFSIVADPAMRSLEHLFRGEPAEAASKFVQVALFDQYLDDQILSGAVQNLRDNNNPTTGRPIYDKQIDGVGGSLTKSMFFVFKEAYQPSVMKRAIDSYRAVGADYTEFDDSPLGIALREFYPVKRHDVELDKSLRRYLADTREVYNRVVQRKNALFSKKAIEPEDVRELIESEIEDRLKLNEDIYRKLRGFEGLGLTPEQLYQITTGAGYGKSRMKLLFNKLMDRPVLNPEFIKKLTDPDNEQGLERLKTAADVLRATPRYILLEP